MAETYYAWNPVFDCITKETDAAGATIAEYTHEPKLYGGLISQHRSGASSFYHYDAIGTTRALTDSSQTVTDTAVYTAFGEKAASVGSTVNPFGFGGRLGYAGASNTTLLQVRARSYSPTSSRWLSVDPLQSNEFSQTHYSYVTNRPLSLSDPSGLTPIDFEFNAFIHSRLGSWFREPGQFIEGPEPTGPGEWGSGSQFDGNHRKEGEKGTSKISSVGWIESMEIGYVVRGDYSVTQTVGTTYRRRWYSGYGWVTASKTAKLTVNSVAVSNTRSPVCKTVISFKAQAAYPFATYAPAIDYSVNVSFEVKARNVVYVTFSGEHDLFPDFEGLLSSFRTVAYYYKSEYDGPGVYNLGTSTSFTSKRWSIRVPTSLSCCKI